MKSLNYPLFQNGYINRFLTVGVFSKESPYSDATLQGKVNEWLIKGPAIHDHPDRIPAVNERRAEVPPYIDFEGTLPGDEVTVYDKTEKVSVYFPFGNTGYDASAFFSNPVKLRSYAFTYLLSPREESAGLQLTTPGALTLWVNDELVTDFTPLVRNEERSEEVMVTLHEGLNKLVMCLDDIAARDTDYKFSMRYMGSSDVQIVLPVGEKTDVGDIYKAEKALSEMYFSKDTFDGEDVWLHISSFSDKPVGMKVLSDRCKLKDGFMLQPGDDRVLLFTGNENPYGWCHFMVIMSISGIRISNVVGAYFMGGRRFAPEGGTYGERKKLVQDQIAAEGGMNEYSMLMNLQRKTPLATTNDILREYLDWIVKKKDCSDFRMILVAYVYAYYRDLLSDDIVREIKDAMIGYRYWIDEPGSDVMWFFSENHAILFHVSQYIAGLSMPDAVFEVSKLTGSQMVKKAEGLLKDWFDAFFDEFVTEWNSSTYVPVDVTALAYLYDVTAPGTELHENAKKALDMLAFSFAVYEHKGVIQSTFGRTYEKELKGSYSTGIPSLLYLLYNAGHMNEHMRALTPIVLGDYEPPAEYGKYTKLSGTKELIYTNTQGIEKYVNLYLYKNSKVALSTAVEFEPYKRGYQENITLAAVDGCAQVFINHPGEIKKYGYGRPGYWAGNGSLPEAVQFEKMSILRYRIPEDDVIDFTHAYVPLAEFDDYAFSKDAIALTKDGGFIGVKALNGFEITKMGCSRDRELVSVGRNNVWIVRVGAADEYESVADMLSELGSVSVSEDKDGVLTVVDGDRKYVLKDRDLFVNGEKVTDYPEKAVGVPVIRE